VVNLKFFLVTYDKLYRKVFSSLTPEEISLIYSYAVRGDIPKFIDKKIPVIEEWNLPWHDNRYQVLQYYEYGAIVHCIKNPDLIKDLTHVGLLHYDIIFEKESINSIIEDLNNNPNQIFYIMLRNNQALYFTKDQVKYLCEYMSGKLEMNIDPENIWNNGWISEALSVTPIEIFSRFGEYILKNQTDFESIIRDNRWNIMSQGQHRPCGLVERMWGFYLVSLNLPIKKMNITHDWDSYHHEHGDQVKDLKL